MDAPKDLGKSDKERWAKLFANFQPRNELDVEMAKRFLVWSGHFEEEEKVVASEGTTTEGKNGVPYPNPHYSNMVRAEAEMRRIQKHIEKCFTPRKAEDQDGGQFKGL